MKEYSSAFAQAPTSTQWSWPLDLDRYDKDPHIHPVEYAELEKRFQNGKQGHIYPHTLAILHRFAEPILDVLSYIDAKPETYHQTLRAMLLEMYRRRTTFWAWSIEEWEESICQNDQQFCLRYGRLGRRTRARRYLPVLAYLFRVHPQMERIIELVEIIPLASAVFGKEALTHALEPPLKILQGWGYSLNQPNRRQVKPSSNCLSSRREVLRRVWRLGMEQPLVRACLINVSAFLKVKRPVKPCTRVGTWSRMT